MIAKIMQSAKSFQAVYYNEHKVSEQKAQFLGATNFPITSTSWDKNQYISYLNTVADLNPNVSSRQFHAVISTKGTAHDSATLKMIAEAYLLKMGYDKNPYLLYFHQDTDNNHVHIVTTRVNTEGVKVADSFERKRSLNHIKSIMNQIEQTAKNELPILDVIQSYHYITENQMLLLAHQLGYETMKDQEGNVSFQRDNITFSVLEKEAIEQRIKASKRQQTTPEIERRKQQLKAILMKYESVITDNTEAQLQQIARDKFGVEVIFHRGNNSQHPFGYTLIDHAQKQIYKGSDVVKLSELFKTERTNDKTINQQTHYKNLKDLSQKVEVSTTNQATNQSIQKLNEYLNEHDLLIFEKNSKIYLADEPNGELRELTGIKGLHNKEHFDFISIDGAQYFHEINQGMNQGGGVKVSSLLPSSDESETDRGRRRGIRR
jgi:Relaxase/Mobilisation nuclease domain